MSEASSPSANRPYGLARVCRVWKLPRSTAQLLRRRQSQQAPPVAQARRGPRSALTDEQILAAIHTALRESPWVGEGLVMSEASSPSANRPYGLARVCRVWKLPRSTAQLLRRRQSQQAPPVAKARRGPRSALTDEQIIERWQQFTGLKAELVSRADGASPAPPQVTA